MADKTTTLTVTPRDPGGSRSARRLRHEGKVPGVIYGGEGEAVAFSVDARELRTALHARGAVLELDFGGESTPVVLKDTQHHPLRGETTHVDFLRVDLKKKIGAVVAIELIGGDDAPGITEGGILDQPIREVNVEALPTDIPESIQIDVSGALDRRQHRPVRGEGARRRHAARRPRDGRRLDARPAPPARGGGGRRIEEETGVVGEGEARRQADEAIRRRRRRRRVAARRGDRASSLPRRGAGRLADRRARQPGPRVRAHAAQRRLPGARGAARRWDLPSRARSSAGC